MKLQILGSESAGPVAIEAGQRLNVPTGLQFPDNGNPAKPNFVDIDSECPFLQVIEKYSNGSFDLWNPTTQEVLFNWKAHHLHSNEQDPLYQKPDTSAPSEFPAPQTLCPLPGNGPQPQGGFWIESADPEVDIIGWINPRHPEAIDDNDFDTPFQSIQGFLNAIGEPVDLEDERRRFIGMVASGMYDEDLYVPAARSIRLLGLGPCVLGDGAGQYYTNSTTPRNIYYNYDQAKEFPDHPRPCLSIGTIAPRVDAISTHLSVNTGWIISGSIIGTPGAQPSTTIELYLEGCYIQRGIDFQAQSGIINLYNRRCRIADDDDTGYCLLGSGIRLQISEHTRYQAPLSISRINRSVIDFYEGNITISAIGSDVPPFGFVSCQFQPITSITFNGPVNSFMADATTTTNAIALVSFAGGASIYNGVNNAKCYGYVPNAPDWTPAPPANIWAALDILARPEYGEMYADQNAVATVIPGALTWVEVYQGVSPGELYGITFQTTPSGARLRILQAGRFKVQYSASIVGPEQIMAYEVCIAVNSNPIRKSVAYQDQPVLPTAPQYPGYENISGQSIMLLNTNDEIMFLVRNMTDPNNLIVRQLNLSVERIK